MMQEALVGESQVSEKVVFLVISLPTMRTGETTKEAKSSLNATTVHSFLVAT